MTKALYTFSADPITFGHIDIIMRAAQSFERLEVGIGVNPSKHYTFDLDQRLAMAQQALAHVDNVQVNAFEGLAVDYAFEQGASVIVKGIRNVSDLNYEQVLHQVGESQGMGIETHLLFSQPELAHISSTAVKALQKEHGDVVDFVPLPVKQALEKRISGQYLIGITGSIGVGKSYVGESLESLARQRGLQAYNIDMDLLGHKILSSQDDHYELVRIALEQDFGPGIRDVEGGIDRKALGSIVFNDPDALRQLNKVMKRPLDAEVRRTLRGKQGLILINAALLAEANALYRCNNNCVLVGADAQVQYDRLKARGLSERQIAHRLSSQLCYEQKRESIEGEIAQHHHGRLWTFDNSVSPVQLGPLLNSIVDEVDYYG